MILAGWNLKPPPSCESSYVPLCLQASIITSVNSMTLKMKMLVCLSLSSSLVQSEISEKRCLTKFGTLIKKGCNG